MGSTLGIGAADSLQLQGASTTKTTSRPILAASAASAAAASTGSAVAVSLSTNAQRLQAAVANLAALEGSSTRPQLAAQWNEDLSRSVDSTTQASADRQIDALPVSDSDHLDQAKAAQAYVRNRIYSGADSDVISRVKIPFAGLSQTQLAAIANDKTGLYTDYEKSAALYESTDQTNSWVQSNSVGKEQGGFVPFYRESQRQFNLLSPLQQSTYPEGYLQELKIAEGRERETAARIAAALSKETASKPSSVGASASDAESS